MNLIYILNYIINSVIRFIYIKHPMADRAEFRFDRVVALNIFIVTAFFYILSFDGYVPKLIFLATSIILISIDIIFLLLIIGAKDSLKVRGKNKLDIRTIAATTLLIGGHRKDGKPITKIGKSHIEYVFFIFIQIVNIYICLGFFYLTFYKPTFTDSCAFYDGKTHYEYLIITMNLFPGFELCRDDFGLGYLIPQYFLNGAIISIVLQQLQGLIAKMGFPGQNE